MTAPDPVKCATWFRVSTGAQDCDNQVPDVEAFTGHHGYQVTRTYTVSDTAYKNGGGPEYKKALQQALDDAHAGKFSVLVVWALDRMVRDDESGFRPRCASSASSASAA
jgi:DNA invertase Pin-like site-specific DNA recombinase